MAVHDTIVYVGTYTRPEGFVDGKGKGIYVYRLDDGSGCLYHLSTAAGLTNPSFLTVDAQHRYLYVVQEIDDFAGQHSGIVSAFRIDHTTHELTLLNQRPSGGAHPCYVNIDQSGRWLLVANYGGGSVAVLPLNSDGSLGEATAVVKHQEKPTHHDAPHPHSIINAPSENNYVLVADCGVDRIYVYRLDNEAGTLIPHERPWFKLQPGAGPRHMTFDASGRYLYCINERDSTLSVLHFDGGNGLLEELQTLSTLPPNYEGSNSCADIHFDATGRVLYGSNRGHDSIVCFTVDEASGLLELQGHTSTGGRTPRNFGLSPDGTLLLVANQDTDNIVAFRMEKETGTLIATGVNNQVPSPVCICAREL